MKAAISIADKKLTISRLLPFYQDLLTDNQREMSSLFADEDLSLSEISEQYHVSRQSVHDTIAKAERQMSELEQKLKLCSRYESESRILSECSQRIAKLRQRIQAEDIRQDLDSICILIDDLMRKEDT